MNFEKILIDFKSKKILIIGDIMIDSYRWGNVERQSPEAPVPIVNLEKKEDRLGGAGNVALNIKALGAKPILCSVIGEDYSGNKLLELLRQENLCTDGIIIDRTRKTTTKTRIINNSEQIVRIDDEDLFDIKNEQNFLDLIYSKLNQVDVIILQDYNKGVLTENIITNIIKKANQKNIPTIVDPKKKNFKKYKNCTLFKPNLKETVEGLNFNINDFNDIEKAAKKLKEIIKCDIVLITLSENGICINYDNKFLHTKAIQRNIIDISGAGDTVLAVASLCYSINMNNDNLSKICNISGGLVCEKVGVVTINKEELIKEVNKYL